MKKIFLILICLCSFKISTLALENDKFHRDYIIGDYGYIYDKGNSSYYSLYYRSIIKDDTNELAYCIEPGTKLSSDSYEKISDYSDVINISSEQMERVKLIGYYGYLYQNHTDIKWYEATQYLIWQTVKPDNWDIYFVDSNKNKVELYPDEVGEILDLVNNHHDKPNLDKTYVVNYLDDLLIEDDYLLLDNYTTDAGLIKNNKLTIKGDLDPGDYSFNLKTVYNDEPYFYVNNDSQNIFTRGNILAQDINIGVHVTAGRVNINECNEEYYKDEFIGGTYEILNIDDEVVDEITCKSDEDCISKILPIGPYKIRIKELDDDYELNNHIYDVNVVDGDSASVTVCSFKKNRNISINNNLSKSDTFNINNTVNNIFNNISNYYSNNVENNTNDSKETTNLLIDNDEKIDLEKKNNKVVKVEESTVENKKCLCGKDNLDKNINLIRDDETQKEIDIPDTYKNNYLYLYLFLISICIHSFILLKHEN